MDWLEGLAMNCLRRVHRPIVVGLSLPVGWDRLSGVISEDRLLWRLSMGFPTGFTCSKTKLHRSGILIDTVQLLKVLGKLEVRLRYSLEVIHRKAYVSVWIQDSFMISPLCPELGQGKCCLACVSNLSAVPPGLLVGSEIVQCIIKDLIPCNIDVSLVIIEAIFDELQVQLEHCSCFVVAQGRIV